MAMASQQSSAARELCVEYAKSNKSKCTATKIIIAKGQLRIGWVRTGCSLVLLALPLYALVKYDPCL